MPIASLHTPNGSSASAHGFEPAMSAVMERQEQPAFLALRSLARKRSPAERCDFCGAGLIATHQHLVEPVARKLICTCDACALLFPSGSGTKYKRVPRQARWLADFRITDTQWDSLAIPIGLAFFLKSSVAQKVLAFYPSPAGPTESMLPLSRRGTILSRRTPHSMEWKRISKRCWSIVWLRHPSSAQASRTSCRSINVTRWWGPFELIGGASPAERRSGKRFSSSLKNCGNKPFPRGFECLT